MNRPPARPDLRRILLFTVGGLVAAVAGTFLLDPYRNYLLALVAAHLCAIAGLSLLIGRTGQLSLGHAALMASGGYGYALTVNAGDAALPTALQPVVGLIAAVLTATVVGLLLGLAGARLHGPYLAGLTLAVVMALPALTTKVSALGGDQGLMVPFQSVPEALDALIALEQWQAWVALAVLAVVLAVLVFVDSGPTGVRMRAVKDDEVAASLAGIRPERTKVLAFVLSAGAAGAGGAVLCFVDSGVRPGGYGVTLSLLLVVGVVVGGTGRLAGAAIGAALVVLLPWLIGLATSQFALPADVAQRLDGNLAVLVFGLLLICLTVLAPGGALGLLSHVRIRSRPDATPQPSPPPPSVQTSSQTSVKTSPQPSKD
ncbi:branched-chain amino acid ABC transporter permease [Kineosporia sp. NBRC 101677]|uniref:branched-chain amino acid ABC transporter permease n=1 Tax=Kineosporia sp. NBRC 101677 TaxID=3032197 RepID=UPI0024A58FAB|nr:branched-chain amino acid ABC transporter permease [Kineosporia sp. NBRC 101677]GLY15505.1 branched-chain amino acid ABC transporter permease [Kineosporia sp. NBRC 101677]